MILKGIMPPNFLDVQGFHLLPTGFHLIPAEARVRLANRSLAMHNTRALCMTFA
jgi:hypothetical protein